MLRALRGSMDESAMTITKYQTDRDARTASWHLHYQEYGEGQPVVLLHGSGPGTTGWANYSRTIEALAKNHLRVLAPDMPGWGESDAATSDKYDHVAAAVELLDALQIDKAAFVGNSMGGATAIRFAIEHPDRISHLVTMGAPTAGARLFSPGGGPSEGMKALARAYRNPTVETMSRLAQVMLYDSTLATNEMLEARVAAAQSHPEHLENFLNSRRGPVAKWARIGDLSGISAPTLLIHGRDDRIVSY